MNLSGWSLPGPVAKASQLLAGGAVALMLLLVGLQLARLTVREEAKGATLATAIRLVAVPPIAWVVGRLVGLEGMALAVAVCRRARHGRHVGALGARGRRARGLVAAAVVLSTIVSVVTLTVLLALLRLARERRPALPSAPTADWRRAGPVGAPVASLRPPARARASPLS